MRARSVLLPLALVLTSGCGDKEPAATGDTADGSSHVGGEDSSGSADTGTGTDTGTSADTGSADSGGATDSGNTGDSGGDETGATDGGGADTGEEPLDSIDDDGDGYSEADGDCDDEDPELHPGVEEDGANGIDDDCDGLADWDAWTGWDADVVWEGESDWYYSWRGVQPVPDLDGDGIDDLFTGWMFVSTRRSDSPREATNEALMWLADGEPPWSDVESEQQLLVGDLDGDDLGEFALSAESADDDTEGVLVFAASSLADAFDNGELLAADAMIRLTVEDGRVSNRDCDLAWSDDLDGDGVGELLVGMRWSHGNYGEVYGWSAADLVEVGDAGVEDGTWGLFGSGERGYFGYYVFALPDIDGDGYAETLIAEDRINWLVDGDDLVLGEVPDVDDVASARIDHSDHAEAWDTRSPGDIDGDGQDDVLIFSVSNEYEVEGVYLEGRIDVYLDLADGGTFTLDDAAAHIGHSTATSRGVVSMAGPAQVRSSGLDMAFAGEAGVSFVPVDDLPTSGLLDLATWPDRIANDGTDFARGYANVDQLLVLEDLDDDGDADLVTTNPYTDASFGSHGDSDYEGVVSVFFNPLY